MESLLTALEGTALAVALRNSVLAYPLVNAAHIVGIALLIGAILPLDLRLIGVWRSQPLVPLWQVLTRTAGTGLIIAIIFGFLLFITDANDYADSPLFVSKMLLVAAGILNVIALHLSVPDVRALHESLPLRVRYAAALSMGIWLCVLTLGRLIGYF
jgi:hypothetical protein